MYLYSYDEDAGYKIPVGVDTMSSVCGSADTKQNIFLINSYRKKSKVFFLKGVLNGMLCSNCLRILQNCIFELDVKDGKSENLGC